MRNIKYDKVNEITSMLMNLAWKESKYSEDFPYQSNIWYGSDIHSKIGAILGKKYKSPLDYIIKILPLPYGIRRFIEFDFDSFISDVKKFKDTLNIKKNIDTVNENLERLELINNKKESLIKDLHILYNDFNLANSYIMKCEVKDLYYTNSTINKHFFTDYIKLTGNKLWSVIGNYNDDFISVFIKRNIEDLFPLSQNRYDKPHLHPKNYDLLKFLTGTDYTSTSFEYYTLQMELEDVTTYKALKKLHVDDIISLLGLKDKKSLEKIEYYADERFPLSYLMTQNEFIKFLTEYTEKTIGGTK